MTKNFIFFSQALFNIDKPTGGTKRYLELIRGFCNISDRKITSLSVVPLNIEGTEEIILKKSKNPIFFIFKNLKPLLKYKNNRVICFEFYTSLPLILLGYTNVITFVRQNYILCKRLELEAESSIKNKLSSVKILFLTKLEDFVLSRSRLILTQNVVDRKMLIERNPSIRFKTKTIQNNINPSWLKDRNITSNTNNKFSFGFAGKINDPRKGGSLILSAFEELNINEVSLVIAGDNDASFGKNIINLGFQEDITDFLGRIDLLVVPSYTDSFPNIIIEAINFGIPVIGSIVGGIPEILKYDILLFDTNKDSLLNKLKFFSMKDNLRMAKQLIYERKEALTFDWPKTVYELITSELETKNNFETKKYK